jgi:hypothetical protein
MRYLDPNDCLSLFAQPCTLRYVICRSCWVIFSFCSRI